MKHNQESKCKPILLSFFLVYLKFIPINSSSMVHTELNRFVNFLTIWHLNDRFTSALLRFWNLFSRFLLDWQKAIHINHSGFVLGTAKIVVGTRAMSIGNLYIGTWCAFRTPRWTRNYIQQGKQDKSDYWLFSVLGFREISLQRNKLIIHFLLKSQKPSNRISLLW